MPPRPSRQPNSCRPPTAFPTLTLSPIFVPFRVPIILTIPPLALTTFPTSPLNLLLFSLKPSSSHSFTSGTFPKSWKKVRIQSGRQTSPSAIPSVLTKIIYEQVIPIKSVTPQETISRRTRGNVGVRVISSSSERRVVGITLEYYTTK